MVRTTRKGVISHKGKGEKGESKDGKGKGSGKSKDEKPRCATCWKTSHTTDKCWHNSKGSSQGDKRGSKGKVSNVHDGDGGESVLSAGPSASQVGTGSSVVTVPSAKNTTVKHVTDHSEQRLLVVKGSVHQVAGRKQHEQQKFHKIPEDMLFLWNQPGWHDLPFGKVYVVTGKFHQKRNHVTPGPQLSHLNLRTTWQLDDTTQEWECRELQKKWKLLQNPHAPNKERASKQLCCFSKAALKRPK